MTSHSERHYVRHRAFFLMMLCGLAFSPLCHAQSNQSISQLVAKVDPSVVMISIENDSLGSGFVIDGSGLIATNYHVIEGAKHAVVTFPANKEKKFYSVKGFVAVLANKDLALIRIEPGNQGFPALILSDNVPEKGERVFAFGAPLGLSGTVSDGLVSSIRSGEEVRDILLKTTHRDVYKNMMGYDLDAQWIQITAPISPGNSGGPLVNAQGEVVGINTWVFGVGAGQNLNFSISAAHLRKFVSTAGSDIQPLSNLPPARKNRGELGGMGNSEKTLALWKQFNVVKNGLNKKIEDYEKQLLQIVPRDPRNFNRGLSARNKKKADLFAQMAKVYADYANQMKALNDVEADPDLIAYAFIEADIRQRYSDNYDQLSKSLISQSDHDEFFASANIGFLKDDAINLRSAHDILRLKLSKKYNMKFPTLEETKNSTEKSASVDSEPKDSDKSGQAAAAIDQKDKSPSAASSDNRSVFRVWTDRSGKFQVRAKFVGIKDDKVTLEKEDGKTILVPLKSLSEADHRFIGLLE